MALRTGKPSRPSPTTFSARRYESYCLCCEHWFEFELGEATKARRTNCGISVELSPSEVWEL